MKDKRIVYFVLYYLALLMILASRTTVDSEPPMLLRLVYVTAVILPCIINRSISYPAIITVFLTIGHYGFAYSYMPYMTYLYGVLTLMVTVFLLFLRPNVLKWPPKFLLFFTIYVFIVDFITGIGNPDAHFPEDVDWCFLMLTCFFLISAGHDEETKQQFPIAFATITVVLSLFFLLFRNVFIQDYGNQSGLERSGWADPNYYGMVIGMGAIVGISMMLNKVWERLSFTEKNLYRIAVILSLPTLALLASRGAILSFIVASMVLVLYSRARTGYKVALVIFAIAAVVWLYNNQYFELLEYRFANDDGTGSNRTIIWARKLENYAQGNPLQWLFGFGFTGGFNITGKAQGFHNDFLAVLVDYGVVGLSLLVYMFLYPCRIVSRGSVYRPLIIAIILYLVTCCLTLEPFTHALMMFFSFYFFAFLAAKDRPTAFQ